MLVADSGPLSVFKIKKIYIKYSVHSINPLTGTLKPQSKRIIIYSNTVTGTLAVDGWAVTFDTLRRGLWAGCGPAQTLVAVPTVHPSTISVLTSYYSMWHYNCLCIVKG